MYAGQAYGSVEYGGLKTPYNSPGIQRGTISDDGILSGTRADFIKGTIKDDGIITGTRAKIATGTKSDDGIIVGKRL